MDILFDEAYITGIQNRDPRIESHLFAHFKMAVWVKAWRKLRSAEEAEDVVQETLFRVLRYFRAGNRLGDPARLPAFVHTTCQNVTHEILRARGRNPQVPENMAEPVDSAPDLDLQIVTKERQRLVKDILKQLPQKDAELLRLAVLEDLEKEELCEIYGVSEEYLRVLLHRARQRFRAALLKTGAKNLAAGGKIG